MELLAPCGSLEQGYIAINNGADAIYLGFKSFSARMKADNFDYEQLQAIIKFCHLRGVKVYLAINTMIKQDELQAVQLLISKLVDFHIDAVIAVDLAVIGLCNKYGIPIHVSTQAGVHNVYSANFYKELGAKRVILSRECNYADIKAIGQLKDLQTEVFVFGALCIGFSGNCLFSSFQNGNSGNRGRCLQCCRNEFTLKIKKRNTKGHLLSAKDLFYINSLQKLAFIGVDSLKIEGRQKRNLYVALAVSEHRNALDQKKVSIDNLLLAFNRNLETSLKPSLEELKKFEGYNNSLKVINSVSENHLGLYCGEVVSTEKRNGYCFGKVKSFRKLEKGDGIRIASKNSQKGGLTLSSSKELGSNQYYIPLTQNAQANDKVFLTESKSLLDNLMQTQKLISVKISVSAVVGQSLLVTLIAQNVRLEQSSDFKIVDATTVPITQENILTCFKKTGDLPFEIKLEDCLLSENCFISMSQLNQFRRQCFQNLAIEIEKSMQIEYIEKPQSASLPVKRNLSQKIVEVNQIIELDQSVTHIVLSPKLYSTESILYLIERYKTYNLPMYIKFWVAFCNDLELILNEVLPILKQNGIGIFAENPFAVKLARENRLPYIVGSFLNVANLDAYSYFNDADLVMLSSELSEKESEPLLKLGAVYYAYGKKPLMLMKACPLINHFDGNCANCQYNDDLLLFDEKYQYPIQRFKLKGCYFILKNGVVTDLVDKLKINNYNSLIDLTSPIGVEDKSTNAHWEKGIL